MNIPKWIMYFGIPAFLWILYSLDIEILLSILSRIDTRIFFIVVPLLFLITLLKTLRWSTILRGREVYLPLSGTYSSYLASYYAGGVTPGRIGDLLKFQYVKGQGHGIGISLSSAIADRLWDAFAVLIVSVIGFPFILHLSNSQIIGAVAILVITFVTLILVTKYRKEAYNVFSVLFYKLIPDKYTEKFKGQGKEFIKTLLPLNGSEFTILFSTTLLSWIVFYFRYYLLALALGINIGFISISIILSITVQVTLIPLSILGIGTRDAVLIGLLKPFGISGEEAVAYSLAILAVNLTDTFIGFLFWIGSPSKRFVKESKS